MCVDIYIHIERERDEERERAREIDKFPPNIVEFLFSETGGRVRVRRSGVS